MLPFTSTPIDDDADDRELAGEQLPEVDLDALDRAGELEPVDALDPRDARRQRQRRSSSGRSGCRGHLIPIESMWIGSQLGHLKASPVRAADARKTPKFVPAWNEPSPLNAKFRASPVIEMPPIVTYAPTEAKLTERVVRAGAGVDVEVRAVSVRNEPRWICERVGVELERLDVPSLSNSKTAETAVGVAVGAVGDRAVDRLARQEVDAAGRDDEAADAVDAAVERDVAVR